MPGWPQQPNKQQPEGGPPYPTIPPAPGQGWQPQFPPYVQQPGQQPDALPDPSASELAAPEESVDVVASDGAAGAVYLFDDSSFTSAPGVVHPGAGGLDQGPVKEGMVNYRNASLQCTFTIHQADGHLEKKHRKVQRTLGRLQIKPSHPGLNSHKYTSMAGPNGEEVWDSYVENRTPSAWRVFWHYGPGSRVITILSITPHP